jgi:ATP-dependent helicase/nuclease subunit A
MAEEWTPTAEQAAAIAVAGSAAVRAGAGSGKTAVLAHRFVHLLRPRPDGGEPAVAEVGQLLAITFTEKAATEMRRKIREVLTAELDTAPAQAAHWTRVRRDLLGAHISTIHAFCARVLRENPLEAGIDPRAVVLDEHESRAWLEAVVEEALLGRLRAGDEAARELVLRHGLSGGRTGGAVAASVQVLLDLARTGLDEDWLVATTARQAASVPEAAGALRAAAQRIVAALGARLERARESPTVRALADAWPHYEALLRGLGPETPLDTFLTLRGLCRLVTAVRWGGEIGADLALDGVRLRGALASEYGFVCATAPNARLADLMHALGTAVRRRKREEGVLTFDDLIAETHALLRDHVAVRQRYASRFRAILVDEFQDTDRVQAEVVRLLASGEPAPLLFVVGDEKQSIYRFRGADVSVFHATSRSIGHQLPLGTNFRSVPGILAFVNVLAGTIFRVPAGTEAPYWTAFDARHRLTPHREPAASAPAVRLVSFVAEHDRRPLSAAEARELEARALAGVVARLHREEGIRYGEVAVLFRAFTAVKTYENALRRREIPYYVVKGRGFFQCQEVTDVVSVLAAALEPGDAVSLAAALRSPLFGLDDNTLWRLAWPAGATRPALARRFRRAGSFADLPEQAAVLTRARDLLLGLRARCSRATIAELVEEVCAATDFEAVCLTQFQGPQKVANVRKLIELARDWERRRYFTLREFVRTVRRLAATEPREPEAALVSEENDVVRLMTIHQAKGLEFRAVILPDLGRPVRPENAVLTSDEGLGMVSAVSDAGGRTVLANAALERHRAGERDRERAEGARLFYVACTRAKDVLVLLEGKGDARRLRDPARGDPYVWCHQVWDVVGRERVARFAAAAESEETVELGEGAVVRLERAEAYLERSTSPALPAAPRVAAAGERERALVARVQASARPVPTELTTSPTLLADFRRCPRQYWYRHVVALPERGTGGARAALLGTAAHGVLEGLDLAGEAEPDVAARPEVLALRPRDVEELTRSLRAAATALRAEVAAGLEIVGREVPFVLPLPVRRPRVFLHGRLDVLARRGGRHLVRDYKYARPSPAAIAGYGAQLAAYRLAVHAAGADAVDAELVFVRGTIAVRALPPLDRAAEEAAFIEAAEALGPALAAAHVDAFPRRPPGAAACEALGCGYVRRCWGAVTRTACGPPTRSGAS